MVPNYERRELAVFVREGGRGGVRIFLDAIDFRGNGGLWPWG